MWPKGSGILEMKVEEIRNTDVDGDCEHDPVEPADGQDESFRNYAHCLIFRSGTTENDEDRRLSSEQARDLLSRSRMRVEAQLS